jgi:hypothetical protein
MIDRGAPAIKFMITAHFGDRCHFISIPGVWLSRDVNAVIVVWRGCWS